MGQLNLSVIRKSDILIALFRCNWKIPFGKKFTYVWWREILNRRILLVSVFKLQILSEQSIEGSLIINLVIHWSVDKKYSLLSSFYILNNCLKENTTSKMLIFSNSRSWKINYWNNHPFKSVMHKCIELISFSWQHASFWTHSILLVKNYQVTLQISQVYDTD